MYSSVWFTGYLIGTYGLSTTHRNIAIDGSLWIKKEGNIANKHNKIYKYPLLTIIVAYICRLGIEKLQFFLIINLNSRCIFQWWFLWPAKWARPEKPAWGTRGLGYFVKGPKKIDLKSPLEKISLSIGLRAKKAPRFQAKKVRSIFY